MSRWDNYLDREWDDPYDVDPSRESCARDVQTAEPPAALYGPPPNYRARVYEVLGNPGSLFEYALDEATLWVGWRHLVAEYTGEKPRKSRSKGKPRSAGNSHRSRSA